MRVKVENVGEFGVVSDRPPSDIPMNAWTKARNIRFSRNYAEPVMGHKSIFTPAGEAFYITGLLIGEGWVMVYPCDSDDDGIAETLYAYDGDAETEITRSAGDYTGTGRWSGCVANGVVIYNNSGDCPQYWGGDITTDSRDLIYKSTVTWDDIDGADTAYRAQVIRPFRNFLVAMNITEIADYGGADTETRYPYLVHWSDPADPGTIPATWDWSDPATLSGRADLADSPGVVVDGLTLRDFFVVYKEDAIWLMSYIGGQFQFRFDKLTGAYGLLAQDCVVDIGGKHICWGAKRAYMHDGSNIQDIVEDRYLADFLGKINTQYTHKCFLTHNRAAEEVWFCYVPLGGTRVSEAHVYNYRYGTWSNRQLPAVNHIALQQYTPPDTDPASWPSVGDTSRSWDTDTTLGWDYLGYDPTASTLVGAGTALYVIDYGSSFDGEAFTCTLERRGQRVQDGGGQTFVRALYPRFSGQGTVEITVGLESPVADMVDWGTAQQFTVGGSIKTDMTLSGELIAVRFESSGSARWKLTGYEYDAENIGAY